MTDQVQMGSADMTDQVNESILKDLDLRCETNNVLHHTSEISVKELFVRRGQPFTLTLTLSQPFQPELYPLSVTAATGCHYSEERGTVSYFGIPDIVTRSPSAKAVWKIELQEKKSSPKKGVLVLSITPPANAPIGEYIVSAQYRDEEMLLAMPVVLFNPWCPDNKAAVLVVLSAQIEVVKDAIEEIEQALSEVQDPFNDVLDDDQEGDEPRGNQDTYWSDKDRRVIGPCQGLIKASAACLRKLTSAIKANGDVTTSQNLSQLDDLADITKEISPGVDDLALCLYPPMDYSGVESNVTKLAALLKKVLEIIRSSHVCGESELNWVQFLDGAVDHNLQKAKDLIQQDS